MPEEHRIFMIELVGLFPEEDLPPRVHGTGGEVMERIAEEWGLQDDNTVDIANLDGVFPSVRAYRAHQLIEDQMGKSGAFPDPDSLIDAMIREGMARKLTDDEFEDLIDDEELEGYEVERSILDDEWTDGVWET